MNALSKALDLEDIAREEGSRRNIAASIVHYLPDYGVPKRLWPKMTLRAFVWETSGDRRELVRIMETICRYHPANQRKRHDVAAPY